MTKLVWYDNDTLLVAWTVRAQTLSILTLCTALEHWRCRTIHRLFAARGWVDGFEDGLVVAPLSGKVIVRLPQLIDTKSGHYYHVASIDVLVGSSD